MIKIILGILGLLLIAIICFLVVCACIVSGWISEREIKNENKYK